MESKESKALKRTVILPNPLVIWQKYVKENIEVSDDLGKQVEVFVLHMSYYMLN